MDTEVKQDNAEGATGDADQKKGDDDQKKGDAADEVKEGGDSPKKSKYTLPIRVEVNVSVSQIDWTTKLTNEALQTTETTETSQYDLPPMKIADS